MRSELAFDGSEDFPSIEQEGMRVGTDACGCVDVVPVATCVFVIVSIFSAKWEARTSAETETWRGYPEV